MPFSVRWAATARKRPIRSPGHDQHDEEDGRHQALEEVAGREDLPDLVKPHVAGGQVGVGRGGVEGQAEVADEGVEDEDGEDAEGGQDQQVGECRPPRRRRRRAGDRAAGSDGRQHDVGHGAGSGGSADGRRRRGGRPAGSTGCRTGLGDGRPGRPASWRTTRRVPSASWQMTWVSAPSSSTMVTEASSGPGGRARRPSGRTPTVTTATERAATDQVGRDRDGARRRPSPRADRPSAARRPRPAIEVHPRAAQEPGHEGVGRAVVEVLGGGHLLEDAVRSSRRCGAPMVMASTWSWVT